MHQHHLERARPVWAGVGAALLAVVAAALVRLRGRRQPAAPTAADPPGVPDAPPQPGRVDAHEDSSGREMLTGPAVRRDVRRTDQTTARVAERRAAAGRPGLLRAAAVLLLLAGAFVLGSQGLYAHTPLGQDNAVRDLALAVVTGLAGLRLLVGTRPGRSWSTLAACAGLALIACAAFTAHADSAGVLVEAVAGVWIVVAAVMSLDHASAGAAAAPRGRHA